MDDTLYGQKLRNLLKDSLTGDKEEEKRVLKELKAINHSFRLERIKNML